MAEQDNLTSPGMTRPASFDALMMANLPYVRTIARRCSLPQDREDVINETVTIALERWHRFRVDGNMAQWLGYLTKEVAGRRYARKPAPVDAERATQPSQEAYVDLTRAVERLAPRERTAVLGVAFGKTMVEVGVELGGVSKQRVEQIVRVGRRRLVSANDNCERRVAA